MTLADGALGIDAAYFLKLENPKFILRTPFRQIATVVPPSQ